MINLLPTCLTNIKNDKHKFNSLVIFKNEIVFNMIITLLINVYRLKFTIFFNTFL